MDKDGKILKFPHARLVVYELLSVNGLAGPVALAQGAAHFGLIEDEMVSVLAQPPINGNCQCLETTKCIARHFFEDYVTSGRMREIDLEEVCRLIQKHVGTVNCPIAENCETQLSKSYCSKLAPVCLDVLLQHIRPYS